MSDTIHCLLNAVCPEKSVIVNPDVFGYNTEITRKGCWQGLSAEMIANRKFAAVGDDGFPLHWCVLGDGDAASLCVHDGYAGKKSIRIASSISGKEIGIEQEDGIRLLADTEYAVRLAVKTSSKRKITLRFAEIQYPYRIVTNMQWEILPGVWQLVSGCFISTVTGAVRLEIISETEGVFWVGAVSLMPSDSFLGMRRDVVNQLKQLHPAQLRFPGGCYAEFFNWRDGLLPVDKRPPIGPTKLWFLLPDSDDYDTHEVGILEFLALCKEIGAKPAITVRMNENSPEDAADFVEFCNGASDTALGALRIECGGEDYPHVRTWFLGNELWSFGHGELKHAEACGRETARFARAMRAKDSDLQLIGCSYYDRYDWNQSLVRQAGKELDGYSVHCYMIDRFWGRLSDVIRAPQLMLEPFIWGVREQFRSLIPSEQPYTLLFDEWNLRWGKMGTIGMGVFVAGTLHLLCKKMAEFDISAAYFFMAINEGIIDAISRPAVLDIAGIIFDICRKHAGRPLWDVAVDGGILEEGLDLCATALGDGSEPCVTVLNRNVSEKKTVRIKMPAGNEQKKFNYVVWEPLVPDCNSKLYNVRKEVITSDASGYIILELVPAAFAGVNLSGVE